MVKKILKDLFCWALLAVVMVSITSCSADADTASTQYTEDTYTVALVLPFNSQGLFDANGTLKMFTQYLEQAQQGCKHRIRLNMERYDENECNLNELASRLSAREDVKVIIGPMNQDHLDIFAKKLKLNETKALMAIDAASPDIIRASVERGDYFWALTQTDISKCEIILSAAAKMGARDIDLICANSGYTSQTYKDWIPFESTELGLNLTGNRIYSDTTQLRQLIDQSYVGDNLGQKAIICVPNTNEEATIMMSELYRQQSQQADGNCPKLFMSDNTISMNAMFTSELGFTFFTVSPTCSPSSGFYPGLCSYTDQPPLSNEAQLYDALMLSAMALANKPDSICRSLVEITSKEGTPVVAWTPEAMEEIFSQIDRGNLTSHISGASGPLYFDPDNHSCVTQSYYLLDFYENAWVSGLAYYTANEGNHSTSAVADWKWQASQLQDFTNVTYKTSNNIPLDDRWAVVVASSEGIENYRHQADALNVYQYLRNSGYDDDHILLVMADDIANNPDNNKPGQVLGPNGENLYINVHVDYKLHDLSPRQIMDKIATLPCDSDDNVMVFWSGHGSPGVLMWGNETITPQMVHDTQARLKGHFRKMGWFVEACYSGCLGPAIEGFDDVLMMTAANANETSKTYLSDPDLHVFLSNRFSAFLLTKIKDNPAISIRDLYYYLCLQTIGSHPCLFNYTNFGDITQESPIEFF